MRTTFPSCTDATSSQRLPQSRVQVKGMRCTVSRWLIDTVSPPHPAPAYFVLASVILPAAQIPSKLRLAGQLAS